MVELFERIERGAVAVAVTGAGWLAPLPSAFAAYHAGVSSLAWPAGVALGAAVAVELTGLATTSTLLELRRYNCDKRKSDPVAPVTLAGVLVGVYFVAALALVVLVGNFPSLASWVPALFPVLSIAGLSTIAIRDDHRRRLVAVRGAARERSERRRASRSGNRSGDRTGKRSGRRSGGQVVGPQSDQATGSQSDRRDGKTVVAGVDPGADQEEIVSNSARIPVGQSVRGNGSGGQENGDRLAALDRLVEFYTVNPGASYSVAGRSVGRSKSWVVGAVSDLVGAGVLTKNGNGVEVQNG